MTIFIIPLILYFFCHYALKKIIPFLKDKSFVDKPSSRGNHKELIPKGGGIIIIPCLIISILLYSHLETPITNKWYIFLVSILLLFVVSLIDDVKNLSAKIRLSVHFFCVLLSIYFLKPDIIFFINNHNLLILEKIDINILFFFLSLMIVMIWLWIINLFNFMDGMDGLITTQMIFLSFLTNFLALFSLINEQFQFLSLVVLSLFLAFIKYNRPKAQIFLGDSGSIPCGYIAGFILIDSFLSLGPFISFLIIILYFLLDSSITLIKRIYKKENLFVAHSDHFYQRMLRKGYSHEEVLKKISILWIILLFLSILALKAQYIALLLAILSTSIILLYFKIKSKNE
jgi:UDP-N-acetylmuramyl pentapeptide phosphotransferase/UDP-N-acetylglucosamine-1-phosphate transferase